MRLAELLGRLAREHEDDASQIASWINAGDHQTAQRRAHSLKGAAATLGLPVLSQAAGAVEQALKNKAEPDLKPLASCLAVLCPALHALMTPKETEYPG